MFRDVLAQPDTTANQAPDATSSPFRGSSITAFNQLPEFSSCQLPVKNGQLPHLNFDSGSCKHYELSPVDGTSWIHL